MTDQDRINPWWQTEDGDQPVTPPRTERTTRTFPVRRASDRRPESSPPASAGERDQGD